MTWLIIGGLALINAAVFFSGDTNNPQAMRWLFHYLNPYHWPTWYAVNLWLIFAGIVLVKILQKENARQFIHSFYASNHWAKWKAYWKRNKLNRSFVNFVLRRKYGKRLLRSWISFWKRLPIERYHVYATWFFVIVIAFVFFRYTTWFPGPRNLIKRWKMYLWAYPYYNIYEPYYLGPLIDYNMSGKITWKLFIAPSTGLLLIVILLYFASKSRKKRRNVHDS